MANVKHILTFGIGLTPGTTEYLLLNGFGIAAEVPTNTWIVAGNTASIAPYMIKWRKLPVGRDHTQRQLNSGNWEIDMSFDSASITYARQWLEAASATSANIGVLNRYSIGFTDLSSVSLDVVEAPMIENGVAGPWTMVVRGASPNG